MPAIWWVVGAYTRRNGNASGPVGQAGRFGIIPNRKMNGKIEEFVKDIKEQLGAACVGVIDKSKEEGQIGFATTEPDQGENVPGKYNELFEKAIAKHGLEHCVHMPFPVSGRLVYTVAGLKRYA